MRAIGRNSRVRSGRRAAAVLGVLLVLAAPGRAPGRGADGQFDRRESRHFLLLQDVDIDETGGFRGSRRFEQRVLHALEEAYLDLDGRLGLRPSRRIRVVIYDPSAFDAQFRGLFRFAAAGFYAGIIRIRGDVVVHSDLVRVLHHELVHAALDEAAPSYAWPAWLNEGLAEWFEARGVGKRYPDSFEIGRLRDAARGGQLFALADLGGRGFARLSPREARLAYLQSYGFVDFLVRRGGERSLERLVAELVRTRHLDRALRRIYRGDLTDLEGRFAQELAR